MNGGQRDVDPLGGGLTHNPFAALGGARPAQAGPSKPAEASTDAPPEAAEGRLVVRRERKGHGGKTVTRVEGLGPATERVARARDLARALGAGARVDGDDLVVQGDLVSRVAAWFEERGHAVVRGN